MKLFYLFITMLFISNTLSAQTSIYGKVSDAETGEDLIFANIVAKKNGVFAAGGSTDFEGNFSIPVDPGTYNVKVSYTGYPEKLITGVIVKAGQATKVDFKMENGIELCEVVVRSYKVPLISADCTSSGGTLTSRDISSLPTKNISAMATSTAGLSSVSSGDAVTIRGSRPDATSYYIDGIRVSGTLIATKSITEMSAYDLLTGTEASSSEILATEIISLKDYSNLEEVLPTPPKKERRIKPGILTAGEWNALEHWRFWNGLLNDQDRSNKKTWNIIPKERFVVQVKSRNNIPLPNAKVELIDVKGEVHWTAISDNTGKAELWANLYGGNDKKFNIIAYFNDQQSKSYVAKRFKNGRVQKVKIPVDCQSFHKADVLFVVDATGSMGDEIRYLQSELEDVIKNVHAENKHLDIQTGSVFYRDQHDQYLTRVSPLSSNLNQNISFIQKQGAGGGGDYPEAVHSALEEALKQDWRPDAITRIAFLLLDAPPHQEKAVIKNLQATIRAAAAKGIRIIPIAASGVNPSTEYLMKAISIATNGTYVFITDDSGVGHSHLKPKVTDFEVEMLNDLMVRLISEFSSQNNCKKRSRESENLERQKTTFSEITIYPNPAQNVVSIELKEDIKRLDILSITGKKINSLSNLKAGETRIDLSNFASGIYILQFHKDNNVTSKKLIIAKD